MVDQRNEFALSWRCRSGGQHVDVASYIDDLATKSRYHFTVVARANVSEIPAVQKHTLRGILRRSAEAAPA